PRPSSSAVRNAHSRAFRPSSLHFRRLQTIARCFSRVQVRVEGDGALLLRRVRVPLEVLPRRGIRRCEDRATTSSRSGGSAGSATKPSVAWRRYQPSSNLRRVRKISRTDIVDYSPNVSL
ncbi:hypothetical protein PMAYCL1PPCAC_19877, partial [Pristionchus mayeri]